MVGPLVFSFIMGFLLTLLGTTLNRERRGLRTRCLIAGTWFLWLPILLIAGEDTGFRDCCIILVIYPLWFIPIIVGCMLLFIYCFILNKTLEEGYIDFEGKYYESKIYIERLLKR